MIQTYEYWKFCRPHRILFKLVSVRFKVLTGVTMKSIIFWSVTPYSLVEV
jgi:hypothetical protein